MPQLLDETGYSRGSFGKEGAKSMPLLPSRITPVAGKTATNHTTTEPDLLQKTLEYVE